MISVISASLWLSGRFPKAAATRVVRGHDEALMATCIPNRRRYFVSGADSAASRFSDM
jgi:hypothetical protein